MANGKYLNWEDNVCGVDALFILVATNIGHALHVLSRIITAVESHIHELLVDGIGPEDLQAGVGKDAGIHLWVVHLLRWLGGHIR